MSEAAYREARARGYDGDHIVLMGASLGTGVAAALAGTHGAAALVLEAPYLSALDVASARYPFFPISWLMLDQFRLDFAIRRVHVPVLMLHGEEDDVIPISSAKRLFALANEPKTFMSAPGGGHIVIWTWRMSFRACAMDDSRTFVSLTFRPGVVLRGSIILLRGVVPRSSISASPPNALIFSPPLPATNSAQPWSERLDNVTYA